MTHLNVWDEKIKFVMKNNLWYHTNVLCMVLGNKFVIILEN